MLLKGCIPASFTLPLSVSDPSSIIIEGIKQEMSSFQYYETLDEIILPVHKIDAGCELTTIVTAKKSQ